MVMVMGKGLVQEMGTQKVQAAQVVLEDLEAQEDQVLLVVQTVPSPLGFHFDRLNRVAQPTQEVQPYQECPPAQVHQLVPEFQEDLADPSVLPEVGRSLELGLDFSAASVKLGVLRQAQRSSQRSTLLVYLIVPWLRQ